MRSKEFITESIKKEDLFKWAQLIKRDCQQYIKEMKGEPLTEFVLYRGIPDKRPFLKKSVRLDNRMPVDTTPEIHELLNKYFVKKFGAPFRNAMFCSGNMTEVGRYGAPYYIFPIGNYRYVWSSIIDDLYIAIRYKENEQESIGQDELNNLLDSGNYQTTDLSSASESDTEVMIRCKEYYAINVHMMSESDLHNLEEMLQ